MGTAAGEAALEGYDPIADHPILTCNPISPVQTWSILGTPTEISREGDEIHIRHEFMGVVRVIHMSLNEHPENAGRSAMGHSIGRFEDGDLVLTWTATDFEYYSAPLTGSRIMVQTDLAIGPYNCVPGLGHEATVN